MHWNKWYASQINSFLENRFQGVVLNGQKSTWEPVLASAPKASLLGLLLFLIYINCLSKTLPSNNKLFANDTSTLSTAKYINVSTHQVNGDLEKISNWVHQWKMLLNSDPKKQVQKVIFSRKWVKDTHPSIFFKNVVVEW